MIKDLYEKFISSTGITTDSRNIIKGNLFFALKGDNFNGNKFAKQAIENGASFAIVDEGNYQKTEKYILVLNVLETLQDLAAFHRAQFNIPVIGITGSNGKTTTKELINAILSTKFRTFATKGNFNNHIGVPLSLLAIKKDTEIAIIEMGANHVGEIASYCKWVKPTLGLITNIGKAHLEGFGSFENIIKAKTELYKELKENKKIIFFNEEDDLIKDLVKDYTFRISYGSSTNVDTQVELLNSFPTVQVLFEETKMQSKLFGEYNYPNISAAIAIASYFDVPKENIKTALENYVPDNNRSEIKQLDTNIIILDAYNANPTSVKAAINSFYKLEVQNKVLIIGDMFELGKNSVKMHQEIVDFIDKLNFQKTILVGKIFSNCKSKKEIEFIQTSKEAKKWFQNQCFEYATILIKGSRGMKMEELLNL